MDYEKREVLYKKLEDSYDLRAAIIENNIQVPEDFTVAGEVLSEHHDEGTYHWLLLDNKTGKYLYLTGGHDYTGWDCQSSANISNPFNLDRIHLEVPEFDNQARPVRKLLLEQATK